MSWHRLFRSIFGQMYPCGQACHCAEEAVEEEEEGAEETAEELEGDALCAEEEGGAMGVPE